MLKAAELRLDGNMLGVLFKRLDQAKAFFHNDYGQVYLPGSWKSVSVAKETKKPDSRLAYSQRTRNYLRRRSMRLLQRLGEADDLRYLDVAVGVLNSITDDDQQGERRSEVYRWLREGGWRKELVSRKHYDGFASYLAFNFILHHNSDRFVLSASKKAWHVKQIEQREQIEQKESATEAFPDLWDQQPHRLLQLLKSSRCQLVHQFATGALQRHSAFCLKVPIEDWLDLLSSVYAETVELALQQLMNRFDPKLPDWRIIIGCLNATIIKAREQALAWLEVVVPPLPTELLQLWALFITSPYSDIRQWAKQQEYQVQQLSAKALLPELLKVLNKIDDDLFNQVLGDISWLFCEKLVVTSQQLPLDWIEPLIASNRMPMQLLGAYLLEVSNISYTELPVQLLQRFAQSESAELQAVGIRLLSKMSDQELRQQAGMLAVYAQSTEIALRQAALPLLARIAQADQQFADDFVQQMLPILFQSEVVEGVHDDVITLLKEQLSGALQRLNKDTTWRLLQARSRGAQRLGMALLEYHLEQLSVRQWAVLGNHPLASVRKQVLQAFEQYSERVKAKKSDALCILVTEWEEVRVFAIAYFRQQFTATDWDAELLVHLVDHVEDTVQQFGRELITQYFTPELGPQLLMQLSQHPATNVQLFVSHFLQDYAAGQPERILQLRHYFITVLSQINRGRVTKDRVFQFLINEALLNEQVALMVVELFNHLSLTVAVGDKAAVIEALLQLQLHYPQLPSVLKTRSLPTVSAV